MKYVVNKWLKWLINMEAQEGQWTTSRVIHYPFLPFVFNTAVDNLYLSFVVINYRDISRWIFQP